MHSAIFHDGWGKEYTLHIRTNDLMRWWVTFSGELCTVAMWDQPDFIDSALLARRKLIADLTR